MMDDFRDGHIRVMVATKAFGLGIDNSNIGFVCHASPPASLEGYCQALATCCHQIQSMSFVFGRKLAGLGEASH